MAEYIEREAAEEIFAFGKENWKDYEAAACIAALPSADVQPVRHGRWKFIAEKSWHGGGKYECSACKYGYAIGAYHEPDEFTYCPHCGAKMDGGDTSERQTMAYESQNA